MNDSFDQKRSASVCPVCCGKCQVPNGFYNPYGTTAYTSTSFGVEMCKSCAGTGVVWSPTNITEACNKYDREYE